MLISNVTSWTGTPADDFKRSHILIRPLTTEDEMADKIDSPGIVACPPIQVIRDPHFHVWGYCVRWSFPMDRERFLFFGPNVIIG